MKLFAALLLSTAALTVHAEDACPALNDAVGKAQNALKIITLEKNLPTAKMRADDASDLLMKASSEIYQCGCPAAGAEFSNASSAAGRAATAINLEEFMPFVDTGVQRYNLGIQYLMKCAMGE